MADSSQLNPGRRFGYVVFGLCVCLNLAGSFVGFRNSPMEIHEFRQLQTALTSRAIQESGWSLAYPTPLFGPPWSVPMEFPIYETCVARLASLTHLPIEPAARLVALGFLYLSLPACYGLAGLLGLAPARRWLGLGLLLVSPVFWYYSRSIMIESTALCGATWFLYGYIRGLESGRPRWLAVAAGGAIFAALAKVTTLIVFFAFAAACTVALLVEAWSTGPERLKAVGRIVIRALVATVPSVLIGWWWVRFSDGVKTSNPLAAFLASGPMSGFNFGSIGQRLSADFWGRIAYHTTNSVVPAFNLALVFVFGLLADGTARRRTLLLVGGFIAGPLIFSNLYFVHDYYFYASALFLVGALLVTCDRLLDFPGFSPAAKILALCVVLAVQAGTYARSYLLVQDRPTDQPPELARIVAAATLPDDIVLFFGHDWDSKIPYFSHRRAIMVTDLRMQPVANVNTVLDRVPPGAVTALVVSGPMRSRLDYFKSLVERLRLHPAAAALNLDTVVFVAESRLERARVNLAILPLKHFELGSIETDRDIGVQRARTLAANLPDPRIVGMMHPLPDLLLHPFALSTYELDGKTVFNAHAPTDIVFTLPAHPTEAVAEFGVLPSAYTGENSTEGMEFRVEWVNSDGQRRTLYSSYLDPSHRSVDRGEKHLRVRLPNEARGQLWFRTLPGPTGSISCAWAYWQKIEIK